MEMEIGKARWSQEWQQLTSAGRKPCPLTSAGLLCACGSCCQRWRGCPLCRGAWWPRDENYLLLRWRRVTPSAEIRNFLRIFLERTLTWDPKASKGLNWAVLGGCSWSLLMQAGGSVATEVFPQARSCSCVWSSLLTWGRFQRTERTMHRLPIFQAILLK